MINIQHLSSFLYVNNHPVLANRLLNDRFRAESFKGKWKSNIQIINYLDLHIDNKVIDKVLNQCYTLETIKKLNQSVLKVK